MSGRALRHTTAGTGWSVSPSTASTIADFVGSTPWRRYETRSPICCVCSSGAPLSRGCEKRWKRRRKKRQRRTTAFKGKKPLAWPRRTCRRAFSNHWERHMSDDVKIQKQVSRAVVLIPFCACCNTFLGRTLLRKINPAREVLFVHFQTTPSPDLIRTHTIDSNDWRQVTTC